MSSQLYKIQSSLKSVKDPEVRERLLMVQAVCQEPLRDAAKKFGCGHDKVNYWKKRYESGGIRNLYTKPRSGRPAKISEEEAAKLRRTVRKHNPMKGWRTQGIRELIAHETGVTYSFRHTIRVIQSWGMSKVKPRPRYAFSKEEDRKTFLKKPRGTWHASHADGK
jgi:putative transposase